MAFFNLIEHHIHMRSTFIIFLIIIISFSVLSGCGVFDNEIQVEKRLALFFRAQNLGDTLASEQDSLVITDFKFSVDRFVVAGNNIELESSAGVSTFLFTYDLDANNERLVIEVGLGVADNFTFNNYSMFVEPVSDNANILDTDFFGDGETFSMIIKGDYNGRIFDFRISPTFEKVFSYDPVTLTDVNETLLLNKTINLESIFINPDGSILDPTDSDNETIIRERVSAFLEVQGFAVDLI